MNVKVWLNETAKKLEQAGIGTARLDTLVLLEAVLGKDRTQLLANPDLKLDSEQKNKLNSQIDRRLKHEPLAYILGQTEFYGREFYIDARVLEPRPESETMIELLKKLPLKGNRFIADVGTGSGAIGITASLVLPYAKVDLLEIDDGAIQVAKKNVIKFATKNRVLKSDLLANAPQAYNVLLCNLPYVPDTFSINPAAMREPKIAIFGGPDGLDVYRRLFDQLKSAAKQPSFVLTESMPPQHKKLVQIAESADYKLKQTDDFIQVFIQSVQPQALL